MKKFAVAVGNYDHKTLCLKVVEANDREKAFTKAYPALYGLTKANVENYPWVLSIREIDITYNYVVCVFNLYKKYIEIRFSEEDFIINALYDQFFVYVKSLDAKYLDESSLMLKNQTSKEGWLFEGLCI